MSECKLPRSSDDQRADAARERWAGTGRGLYAPIRILCTVGLFVAVGAWYFSLIGGDFDGLITATFTVSGIIAAGVILLKRERFLAVISGLFAVMALWLSIHPELAYLFAMAARKF